MAEPNTTTEPNQNTQSNKTNGGDPPVKQSNWPTKRITHFAIICLVGAGLILITIVSAYRALNPQEPPYRFITTNAINILIFVVIIIQAYITNRQWKAARAALKRTDKLLRQNERMIKASQRQARASEKALKMTREHFEYIERPVLGFEHISMFKMPDGSGAAVGLLVNSGKTPGRIVEQFTAGAYITTRGNMLDFDFPTTLPPAVELLGSPTIHIGGKREVHFTPVTMDEWADIKAERQILFIWGRFTYQGLGDTDKGFILEHYSAYNPRTGVFVECPTNNEVT